MRTVNFFICNLLGIFEACLPTRNDIKLVVRQLQSFVYPNSDGDGTFLRVLQRYRAHAPCKES